MVNSVVVVVVVVVVRERSKGGNEMVLFVLSGGVGCSHMSLTSFNHTHMTEKKLQWP